MLSSPLIIDISFVVFILIFSSLGIKNGFIAEFQKLINIFISILIANFIVSYLVEPSTYTYYLVYFLILICSILIMGFIIDTVIYNLNIVKLDQRSDKLIGCLLGAIKSLLIIMLIIYSTELIPLQRDIKIKIHNKMKYSNIYVVCEKFNTFIFESTKID